MSNNVLNEYLQSFEEKLYTELLKLCTQYIAPGEALPQAGDVEERWNVLLPEYMADAVPQIASYPTVSLAWAGYLGMAVAHDWDTAWEQLKERPYKDFYGVQGFDDMDENIVENYLGIALDSQEAQAIEGTMRRLAQQALTLIRRENIEPQSPTAFYAYTKAVNCIFRIGAGLELLRLGYKYEKVNIPVG